MSAGAGQWAGSNHPIQTGALKPPSMEQAVLTELKAPGKSCSAPADFALNLTIVYEDAATREWAAEVCGRVARLVGKEAVRSTWWKLSDLNGAAVLAGAVSTALRSDVVVVAIHAAEKLSLPFYVWVDSWLPHRPARLAALVALVALPRQPSLALERAQDYLRAVAREGQLDFLLEERRLAAA